MEKRLVIKKTKQKNMRQIFKSFMAFSLAVAAMAGCTQYDDTDIKNHLVDLDKRVKTLEEAVEKLNININGLAVIIDGLKNLDTIEKVEMLEGNKGWTFTFTESGVVTIYNGVDGNDGVDGHNPQISIAQDIDGEYYWTLDGDWLLVDGKKVLATAKAETPQLNITTDGILQISYDGGLTWDDLGQAGISSCVLKTVLETADNVTLVLSDGGNVVIPKGQTFALQMTEVEFAILAGKMTELSYTVTSPDNQTIVDGFGTNGYDVVVESADMESGVVKVTAPDPVVDGKVFVLAINAKGTTSAKVIYAKAGYMNIGSVDATAVSADGADLSWEVSTNLDYIVVSDSDWLTYKKTSSGLTVIVGVNTKDTPRSGSITISDKWGVNVQTLSVVQVAADYSIPGYKGPIDDWRDEGTIEF